MKFFDLVVADIKKLWQQNKLVAVLAIALIVIAVLSLIPAIGAIITFALKIIAVGVIAFAGILAIILLINYIKQTIRRTKE